MTQSWNSGWMDVIALAQAETPQAGAAPAAAQPATPVGVPGATTTAPGGTANAPLGTPGGAPTQQGPNLLLMVLPIFALFILFSFIASRKDKKKRAELMTSIKRGDKVQMIGGIIGTVGDISDDELVLKVEEGRIRFHKSAVQSVVSSSRNKGESSIAEVKGEAKATSV